MIILTVVKNKLILNLELSKIIKIKGIKNGNYPAWIAHLVAHRLGDSEMVLYGVRIPTKERKP